MHRLPILACVVTLTACGDAINPVEPKAGPLDVSLGSENPLANRGSDIVMPADFDDSAILASVKRYDQQLGEFKAVSFRSDRADLTILLTSGGKPRASMVTGPDGSTLYSVDGRPGSGQVLGAPASLRARGNLLVSLVGDAQDAGAPNRDGVAFSTIDPGSGDDCITCIIPPTEEPKGGPIDFTGAYTKHIVNIDTFFEYTSRGSTNGCTNSPDGHWRGCCDMHDYAYGDGGDTDGDRQAADWMLLDCMSRVGSAYAAVYYTAVRSMGSGAYNWRHSVSPCYLFGSQGQFVYGPGRYTNNIWGLAYRIGDYMYSDTCRANGYNF